MKLLPLLFCLGFVAAGAGAAIVNNSAVSPTGEDSLAVPFCSLDSLGNPAAADSFFVTVLDPSGVIVFADSMASSDSRIESADAGGGTGYVFRCQVSQIDGSGSPGVYALLIAARNSSLGLSTPSVTSFQIVQAELSDRLALLDDTVWVAGGAVDSNRTERGLSAGAGSRAVTLIALDTASTAVIPGVRITVRSLDQTALLGLGLTDVTGAAAFSLDNDSCLAVASAAGYRFAPYDTALFEAATVDTLFGFAWFPEPPPQAGLCRVWGMLYGVDGVPLSDADVQAALVGGVARFAGSVVSPEAVSASTDSTGLFQLDLIPSAALEADDTRYDFTIRRPDGVILRRRVTVPAQDVWQLTW